ncbi:MAG TPA: hypothetical protein VK608_08150, partial [Edaphobacter sp.]|nr:hypothetical protein [Edaphobacter sp.]
RVGKVHRAVKTPATIHKEIVNGVNPALTNFVGASAAPSHIPAVMPHRTPRPWCVLDSIKFDGVAVAIEMKSKVSQG